MQEEIKQIFLKYWSELLHLLPKLTIAAGILVLFVLAGILLNKVFKSRLRQRWKDKLIATFIGEAIKWTLYIIGVLAFLNIMGFGGLAGSLLAGAGISAIIVGFAFKDIAENLLAGVLLTINRPFEMGDVVEVDKYKGPVKSMDLRHTHIRVADGRDIYIPNSMIFKNVFTNYTTDGLLRQDFVLRIDMKDDFEKVKSLILSYLKKEDKVLERPVPNVIIEDLPKCFVSLKVLFWIDISREKIIGRENNQDTGMLIKSKVIGHVKDLLLREGFSLCS